MMDSACAEYDVLRNKNRLLEQESNSLFLYDLCQTVYPSPQIGNEGLFNLRLAGNGVCVLESNVPRSEIVEIDLQDDVLKIDGSFAICWSGSLSFTVERSGKTLLGSAASGEGLVNVYKGIGKVWLAPLTPSQSLVSATHAKSAK